MKNIKSLSTMSVTFMIVFLFMVSLSAGAMGNSEKPYGIILDEQFSSIAESLESGEIDLQAAIDQLNELRTANSRKDGEDYRTMEKLLMAVQNREMTAVQAREQARLLPECETGLSQSQLQQRERNTVQTRTETETITSDSSTGSGLNQASGSNGNSGNSSGSKK